MEAARAFVGAEKSVPVKLLRCGNAKCTATIPERCLTGR